MPSDSPTPPRETEASKPSDTPAGDKILYSDGGLVIVGNRAMEIFGGSKKVAKTYALNLNAYKEALGSNVNIYSMVIPVASAFYYNEGSSRSECVDIIGMVS